MTLRRFIYHKGLEVEVGPFYKAEELHLAFHEMDRLYIENDGRYEFYLYGGVIFKEGEHGAWYAEYDHNRHNTHAIIKGHIETTELEKDYFKKLLWYHFNVREPVVLVQGAVMRYEMWKERNFTMWSHKAENGMITEHPFYFENDEYDVHMVLPAEYKSPQEKLWTC